MSRITGTVKAAYNFFAGDAIILAAVMLAFGVATVLVHLAPGANVAVAVLFVAFICGGLIVTLGRELAGRKRG